MGNPLCRAITSLPSCIAAFIMIPSQMEPSNLPGSFQEDTISFGRFLARNPFTWCGMFSPNSLWRFFGGLSTIGLNTGVISARRMRG